LKLTHEPFSNIESIVDAASKFMILTMVVYTNLGAYQESEAKDPGISDD